MKYDIINLTRNRSYEFSNINIGTCPANIEKLEYELILFQSGNNETSFAPLRNNTRGIA